jgi:multicomponent Na+:H+ antiporter subunit F
MHAMTPWLVSSLFLVIALAVGGLGCLRGGLVDRLVALELVTAVGTLMLVTLATHEGRPFYYDVALTVALTSLASTLAFARFLEHWL